MQVELTELGKAGLDSILADEDRKTLRIVIVPGGG